MKTALRKIARFFNPSERQRPSTKGTGNADWEKLEHILGVRFKEPGLLQQAMVHRSFLNEQPDAELISYDRLEYLGDAFLGWIIADELYARFPDYDEGDLTRARALLVRGTTLAEVATGLGIGPYLILGQGEELERGRQGVRTLAGCLEAVLGAVLLDQGSSRARALVLDWLDSRMVALGRKGAPRDAKSALQELLQSQARPLPVYEVIAEGMTGSERFTVMVSVDGVPSGEGVGPRRAVAEQAAAKAALAQLAPVQSSARRKGWRLVSRP
jgi:ribonuclease-3